MNSDCKSRFLQLFLRLNLFQNKRDQNKFDPECYFFRFSVAYKRGTFFNYEFRILNSQLTILLFLLQHRLATPIS